MPIHTCRTGGDLNNNNNNQPNIFRKNIQLYCCTNNLNIQSHAGPPPTQPSQIKIDHI